MPLQLHTQSSETAETTQLATRRPIPLAFQPEQRLYQKHWSHILKSFFFLSPVAVLLQCLQINGEQLVQMYCRQSNNVASGLRFLLLRGLTSVCMQPLHRPPVLTHTVHSSIPEHICTVTARNSHTRYGRRVCLKNERNCSLLVFIICDSYIQLSVRFYNFPQI